MPPFPLTAALLHALPATVWALPLPVNSVPQGTQAIQVAKVIGSDIAQGEELGNAVSLSGQRALVGSQFKAPIGGFLTTGAAYVFERQGDGSWLETDIITGFDSHTADLFGCSVAISNDRCIIGALGGDPAQLLTNAGSAYVYQRQASGNWLFITKLQASDAAPSDAFGTSVALDGDFAVVGAPNDDTLLGSNAGSAYVYERLGGGAWVQVGHLTALDGAQNDFFGFSVAISGTRALVGAYRHNNGTPSDAGAAYVFDRQGDGTWPQVAKLSADDKLSGDQLGYSVSLDGDRALVGAAFDDAGNQNTGSAYVFERQGGGNWIQVAHLVADTATVGMEVGTSVSLDGDLALAGAPGAASLVNGTGAAYLFRRQVNGTWSQAAKLFAADAAVGEDFGSAVALDGHYALAGAHLDTTTQGFESGSAYLYRLCDGCLYSYGTGTPGCAGTHTMGANLAPEIGTLAFALTCNNAPPSSLGLALVSNSQDLTGSDPFAIGVLLHVDLFFATEVLSLDFVSDAAGQALAPAPIPNSPPLVGSQYFACALWAWSSCPLPPFQLSSSRGLALTILAP